MGSFLRNKTLQLNVDMKISIGEPIQMKRLCFDLVAESEAGRAQTFQLPVRSLSLEEAYANDRQPFTKQLLVLAEHTI